MTFIKLALAALGAVTVAIGATLAAVAVGMFTWIGGDDAIEIPEVHVATTDGKVFAEDVEFLFDGARFVPDMGTANLQIRAADGSPVFAGVTDRLTADRFMTDDVDPRSAGFWLASAEGTVADLTFDIEPGAWTFVVVDEDGTAPSSVIIGGEIGAGPFRLAAGTVGALGVATGIAGGLLLIASVVIGRRRTPVPPTPVVRNPVAAGV